MAKRHSQRHDGAPLWLSVRTGVVFGTALAEVTGWRHAVSDKPPRLKNEPLLHLNGEQRDVVALLRTGGEARHAFSDVLDKYVGPDGGLITER